MRVCVPITTDGSVDPRWGRAARVAVADLDDGAIQGWTEFEVGWDVSHDRGSEGHHHARVARFLREHQVQVVVVAHVGAGMGRMLTTMGIRIDAGHSGDARSAVVQLG